MIYLSNQKEGVKVEDKHQLCLPSINGSFIKCIFWQRFNNIISLVLLLTGLLSIKLQWAFVLSFWFCFCFGFFFMMSS